MRRHTAKGVVSSAKLGGEGGEKVKELQCHVEERPQSRESQSRQRKRKVEEKANSGELITNVKKQKI